MNVLIDAAIAVQCALDEAGIAFCFIGGFAAPESMAEFDRLVARVKKLEAAP